MCESLVVYCLQALHELLQVIASDWLRKPSCFGQHDKQVCLIRRENEISVCVAAEVNYAS